MLIEYMLWRKAQRAEDTADAALVAHLVHEREVDDVFRRRRLSQEKFAGRCVMLGFVAWIVIAAITGPAT